LIQERLLERLTSVEAPRLVAGRSHETLVINSIVNHIQRLLNTMRGTVGIDANYGMSDLSNIAGSFSVGYTDFIQSEIIEQVTRYETRLLNPKISTLEELRSVITLKFELIGEVEVGTAQSGTKVLRLFLRVNSAGRVAVEINRGT
jgi:type VI secretion system protein